MGTEVYANGNEVASKASQGKVVAAFPDVCMSPPAPPAGPLPVPYPDSSFAKDMRKGSKSVKIAGQPVMLRDQSYYKSSPLGNEAATRSFGGSVLSHTISGKTYFCAWSFDVTAEHMSLPRHIDLATSNHASYPGGTPPFANLQQQTALDRLQEGVCPCCGQARHTLNRAVVKEKALQNPRSAGVRRKRTWFKRRGGTEDMSLHEWYDAKIAAAFPNPTEQASKKEAFADLMRRAQAQPRPGCTCTTRTSVLPSPPCDVFFGPPDKRMTMAVADSWDTFRPKFQRKNNVPSALAVETNLRSRLGYTPSPKEVAAERQINHLTPKSAGGCPTGSGNLQKHGDLCTKCRDLDGEFTAFQGFQPRPR